MLWCFLTNIVMLVWDENEASSSIFHSCLSWLVVLTWTPYKTSTLGEGAGAISFFGCVYCASVIYLRDYFLSSSLTWLGISDSHKPFLGKGQITSRWCVKEMSLPGQSRKALADCVGAINWVLVHHKCSKFLFELKWVVSLMMKYSLLFFFFLTIIPLIMSRCLMNIGLFI